ncbi:MAG: hypothetical protein M3071_07320 [Actinomycetota bacterium]|nr:hypothetical protein [Actinomycetota bacterium]
MSVDARVVALTARLARMAVAANDIATALEREHLHNGHAGILASPAHYLEVASETIEAKLHQIDVHGESPQP